MKKNETIADIVAEMRRFAYRHRMHGEGQATKEFADRIEAAHKETMRRLDEARQTAEDSLWDKAERDEQASVVKQDLTTGNVAKMREALRRLQEWAAMDWNENAHLADTSGNYLKFIKGTLEIANAALTAPPRNCDTLKSYDEFVDAWNAYVRRTHGGVEGFLAWLSAEAKGEAK